jgi:hypothetical protein
VARELFKTTITLEFGENLVEENKYIIHLELLSCHSNRMAQFFKKSEEQRQLYATAKMWRKEVKSLISRETAPDTFPLDKVRHASRTDNYFLTSNPLGYESPE